MTKTSCKQIFCKLFSIFFVALMALILVIPTVFSANYVSTESDSYVDGNGGYNNKASSASYPDTYDYVFDDYGDTWARQGNRYVRVGYNKDYDVKYFREADYDDYYEYKYGYDYDYYDNYYDNYDYYKSGYGRAYYKGHPYQPYSRTYYYKDGYGSTRVYNRNQQNYVNDGYGSDWGSWDNKAGIAGAEFAYDSYGSSGSAYSNRAGIVGASYVKTGYGSSASRSDLAQRPWVKVGYVDYDDWDYDYYNYRYDYNRYGRSGIAYRVHYTPVGEDEHGDSNIYYGVKVQKVRTRSYRA